MPDINLANTCDNCDKHLRQIHESALDPSCDRCLLDGTVLRTCGGCHETRYCGTDCQKKHWKAHKASCAANQRSIELSKEYGPLVAAQRARVLRWAKKSRGINHVGACFALGVGSDEDRSQSHCFLIMVKGSKSSSEENPNALSPISVISAEAIADNEIRKIFTASEEGMTNILKKQANCIKLIVFDGALPSGLGLVHMQLETADIALVRQTMAGVSFSWRPWLDASFAAGTIVPFDPYLTPRDSRQKVRIDALTTWYTKYAEEFSIAAYSALNLQKNTKKSYTHALRVYVDAKSGGGQVPFQFKVRSAGVIDLNTMEYGSPPTASQGFVHTIIVDDTLPPLVSNYTIALDTSKNKVRGMYQHRENWIQHLKRLVDQF